MFSSRKKSHSTKKGHVEHLDHLSKLIGQCKMSHNRPDTLKQFSKQYHKLNSDDQKTVSASIINDLRQRNPLTMVKVLFAIYEYAKSHADKNKKKQFPQVLADAVLTKILGGALIMNCYGNLTQDGFLRLMNKFANLTELERKHVYADTIRSLEHIDLRDTKRLNKLMSIYAGNYYPDHVQKAIRNKLLGDVIIIYQSQIKKVPENPKNFNSKLITSYQDADAALKVFSRIYATLTKDEKKEINALMVRNVDLDSDIWRNHLIRIYDIAQYDSERFTLDATEGRQGIQATLTEMIKRAFASNQRSFLDIYCQFSYIDLVLPVFSEIYEALSHDEQSAICKIMVKEINMRSDDKQRLFNRTPAYHHDIRDIVGILGHANTIIIDGKEVENFPMEAAEAVLKRLNAAPKEIQKQINKSMDKAIARETTRRIAKDESVKDSIGPAQAAKGGACGSFNL